MADETFETFEVGQRDVRVGDELVEFRWLSSAYGRPTAWLTAMRLIVTRVDDLGITTNADVCPLWHRWAEGEVAVRVRRKSIGALRMPVAAVDTRRDPMDRVVDGLTVRECLERFTENMRSTDAPRTTHNSGGAIVTWGPMTWALTPAQKDAARLAWSAELKRKQAEVAERERNEVVCDDDRWEP